MDLNMTDIMLQAKETLMNETVSESGYSTAFGMNDYLGASLLCLDSMGYECGQTDKTACSHSSTGLLTQDDDCRLALGLGLTPTSYGSDHTSTVNKSKDSANLLSQILTYGADCGMLQLGLSRGNGEAALAPVYVNNPPESPPCERSVSNPIADEGSTSAKQSGGYMPSLLFAPSPDKLRGTKGMPEMPEMFGLGSDASTFTCNVSVNHQLHISPESPASTDCSLASSADPMYTILAGEQKPNNHCPKKCMYKGCSKGARGASGFCIAHGGGQRCRKPGCNKGAESRSAYCKAHGGGRRCQQLGCTKSAEGKTDFCIAHGGGRRCSHHDCTKAARGKSGLCLRHGGGKRCNVEECTRSAEGQSGLCISHGGGRRCQRPGCNKGAQGNTLHCKAHGGGRRCVFEGCTKGAEGSTPLCKGHGGGKRCLFEGGGLCPKSVHGGTDFCVAHGGGKRCAVLGCTKSARGRTDCCVRHGGGKRCQFEMCGKSAQGSTDFCKAHGGGKRCSWGSGCEKFARGKSGLCAAHGSMALSQQNRDARKVCNRIGPGLFHGVVSAAMTMGSGMDYEQQQSSEISAISDCVESSENVGSWQLLAPQVSLPLSTKSRSSSSRQVGADEEGGGGGQSISYGFAIPEGRVHGGGLMSLLGGSFNKAFDS